MAALCGDDLVMIGRSVYLFHIDDLEEALLDPAPGEVRNGPPIVLDSRLPAMILDAEFDQCELQLDEESFIFDPDDFWEAMTDPFTFRPGGTGPTPIDVLRG